MSPQLIISIFVGVYVAQSVISLYLNAINRSHLQKNGNIVPELFSGLLDEQRLSRIKAYSLDNTTFSNIHKVFSDVLLLFIILSGWLNVFDLNGKHAAGAYVSSGLLFFFAFGAFNFVIELPFDYYHTFVIEERHGFNKSTMKTWLIDTVKSVLVSSVLFFIIAAPLLAVIVYSPNFWWIWGVLVFSSIQMIMVILYPILIAPLFNKFEPLRDQDLAESVESLVLRVGMKSSGIFQMDAGRRSSHSNAYFTGIGKTKRIVLFDTLLANHSKEEILAILAHELGHYKLKHIIRSYALSLVVSLVGFYLAYLLINWELLYIAFGVPHASSYVILLIILVFLQKAAFFFNPIKAGLSRKYEREADSFAAGLTGKVGLITALKKLALDNLSNLHPHPTYSWFYYSHPPVTERIKRLESF